MPPTLAAIDFPGAGSAQRSPVQLQWSSWVAGAGGRAGLTGAVTAKVLLGRGCLLLKVHPTPSSLPPEAPGRKDSGAACWQMQEG